MTSEDLTYFRLRAAEERERAANASSPSSRAVHLDMARRYEQACGQLASNDQIEASQEAVSRSLDLLTQTSKLLDTQMTCSKPATN